MTYIHLVIYATHSDGNFDILVQKAHELGYYVSIIGWGDKWQGFYKRTLDLYDFFKTRPPQEIIMCIDGFDSMILKDAQTTLATFSSFDSPIVWGVEESNSLLRKVLFRSKQKYTLNGGSFMGYNEYLQLVFEEIVNQFGRDNFKQDDQRIVNMMNNSSLIFQEIVKPDLESRIFANVIYSNLANTIIRNNKTLSHDVCGDSICHKVTGISPCVVSGPGDVNMNPLLEQIGYQPKCRQDNYYKFFLANFKTEFILFVIFLIAVIIAIYFLVRCLKR
jgi:hypothetical protein